MAIRDARSVTRNDVARIAGVSTAVVSYVVNGGPRPVSASARSRVLAAVEQTGYRVNDVARALASGRSRTFAFAAPSIVNPFIAEIARKLARAAAERGALLFLGDAADDTQREDRLLRSFLQRQVDGIIYMSIYEQLSAEFATGCGIPVVVFEYASPHPRLASVSIDEVDAARRATKHLIEHGRQRHAAIVGPERMFNSTLRHRGWAQALNDGGLGAVFAESTREGGWQGGHQLLDRFPDLDAIFTGNEAQAVGLISAAAERGRHVPDDISVFAFNGTAESRFNVPALSIMRQPIDSMVAAAIDIISATPYRPEMRQFVAQEVPRRSCGCQYEIDSGEQKS